MRGRWRAEVNVCGLVSRPAVRCDKCPARPPFSSPNSPPKPSPPPSFALHPLHHPSLPRLAVVSCGDAMNNSSRWLVLPGPAPRFCLAVARKNIRRRARPPCTRLHQRTRSITCAASSIARHVRVCRPLSLC